MRTLFVSDLHLDPARPAATRAFLELLNTDALTAERLYILGDLFEAWVGDDDTCPHHRVVRDALAEYTASGVPCFFMPGNRDFLIGSEFIAASGMTLLPDPTLIEVAGTSIIISHGDALCADDISYQRFRRITRNPRVINCYNALPFALRNWIVNQARQSSQTATQTKPAEIMDVNQAAVEALMRRHSIDMLLHGHTHRLAEHTFDINGHPAQRIVLGDWYNEGPVLVWDESGRHTLTLAFASAD
jgi:UDP-2,3-diacylglucosamine hydrolase